MCCILAYTVELCTVWLPIKPAHLQVLKELVGDKALQRFRVEYEKLFRVLKKSHGALLPL